jgi:hypothetical protein
MQAKQTESRAGGGSYLNLPKTLGYDASGTDALACIGIRHAFTNRGLLLAAIDSRHGSLGATADVGSQGRVCIGQDQG